MTILSAINYVLGEKKPLDSIQELKSDQEGLDYLKNRGFSYFRDYDGEPWELAVESINKTLEEALISIDDIDEIVYASISSKNPILGDLGIGLMANELGALETPITGITFGECTNIMLALEHANMLIETGRCRNVLLVSSDVASCKEQRMTSGYTVCSDGAASCVVSKNGIGNSDKVRLKDFRKGYHHLSRAGLSYPSKAFKDIANAANNCIKGLAIDKKNVDMWIPNTGNTEVAGAFASVLGIPKNLYFQDNNENYGHVYSTDQLINLVDWINNYDPQKGALACGIATGLSGSCASLWEVL